MPTIKKYQEKDKNAEYVYKFYLNKGYTPAQSSAIVGNLLKESGLKTTAEGDVGYKGGSSFGVAQWRGDRLNKLKSMYGKDWDKLDNQLEFVHWELNNTEKSAGDALKKSNSVWEAGKVFTNSYERPKVKFEQDKTRQTHVADVYRKHSKMELTDADRNMFKPTFSKDVAPYINQESTTPLTNFDISVDSSNFASVPDVPQKEEKPSEALNKLKEEAFIQEYKSFYNAEQPIVQQEQDVQPIQPTDITGIFNDVSQFVDAPVMQSGGEKNSLWKNIRANRGSGKKPTKEMLEQEAKIKRNAQQGIIKDDMGQWKYPGYVTEINSPSITMKNVPYNVLGVSKETGEQKLMESGKNYFFKNTQSVIEYPQLKQNEIEFLKSLR